MKHFRGLNDKEAQQLFHVPPYEFTKETDRKKLGIALGAALYMPGLMPNFSSKLTKQYFQNLTSLFICLEDAISDSELVEAEKNVIQELKLIEQAYAEGTMDKEQHPLLFLRIRSVQQFQELAPKLGSAINLLTGIVFPKCTSHNAMDFLECLDEFNRREYTHLYALPILETKEIIYTETRELELASLYEVFKKYEELILTIRVGATDFSSLFSMRRPGNRTIYDLKIITDCLVDIINRFSRHSDDFVISGLVFEYFEQSAGPDAFLSTDSIEAVLWNEVQLDVLNGLHGKTCIHPSQVDMVNAAYVVSKEMYDDAHLIIEKSAENNGVQKSRASNKMNEVKPHYNWAQKILAQAEIYGVLKEHVPTNEFLRYIKSKNV